MLFIQNERRPDVSRTFPMIAFACLSGVFFSLLSGFFLASWTIAGIIPAHAVPPTLAQSDPPRIVTDGWREAGYERIGLWEQPRVADPYAVGSSRL